MHKVIVGSNSITNEFDFNQYTNFYRKFDEMKDWCRATYGKGYDRKTKTWIWKSGTLVRHGKLVEWRETTVFYFSKEEHATWFLLNHA